MAQIEELSLQPSINNIYLAESGSPFDQAAMLELVKPHILENIDDAQSIDVARTLLTKACASEDLAHLVIDAFENWADDRQKGERNIVSRVGRFGLDLPVLHHLQSRLARFRDRKKGNDRRTN